MNNGKSMLVFDLDGSLLRSDETISDQTVSYIKELKNRGHEIVIASGRPERAIRPYYNQLGLDGTIITYNGAAVRNPLTGEIYQKHTMKKEMILDFLSRFDSDNLIDNMFCEDDRFAYSLRYDDVIDHFFHRDRDHVKIGRYQDILDKEVFVFLFMFKEEVDQEKILSLKKYYPGNEIIFWYDVPKMGEFLYTGVTKGSAIEELAREKNIPMENVYAFGDSDNDIDMLKRVGHGYAMKNANQLVKDQISLVTEYDNNHDGIYHQLYEIFK